MAEEAEVAAAVAEEAARLEARLEARQEEARQEEAARLEAEAAAAEWAANANAAAGMALDPLGEASDEPVGLDEQLMDDAMGASEAPGRWRARGRMLTVECDHDGGSSEGAHAIDGESPNTSSDGSVAIKLDVDIGATSAPHSQSIQLEMKMEMVDDGAGISLGGGPPLDGEELPYMAPPDGEELRRLRETYLGEIKGDPTRESHQVRARTRRMHASHACARPAHMCYCLWPASGWPLAPPPHATRGVRRLRHPISHRIGRWAGGRLLSATSTGRSSARRRSRGPSSQRSYARSSADWSSSSSR